MGGGISGREDEASHRQVPKKGTPRQPASSIISFLLL
jgi:hypothetical protein